MSDREAYDRDERLDMLREARIDEQRADMESAMRSIDETCDELVGQVATVATSFRKDRHFYDLGGEG